ncbi:type VII secretion integral membrane protein EccD [Nocardia sp. NPDC127526]|uniref:type VII secretion integral membrane protein EccD n=1 Tax=Nocardia sp. NPDC127526 TaxID=3345393 RepID=UPI00363E95F0
MAGNSTQADIAPEFCRVSVVGHHTQVDLALPVNVPVAAFIGNVVSLVESRVAEVSPEAAADEGAATSAPMNWTLAKLGSEPIPSQANLLEAGIFDGDLLVLEPVEAAPAPAMFDDVVDAVARLAETQSSRWSAAVASWAGAVTGPILVLAAAVLLLTGTYPHEPAVGAGAVLLGVPAMGAAIIAARVTRAIEVSVSALLCALALLFTGVFLLVPGDTVAAGLLLAATTTFVAAVLGYRLIGAATTLCTVVVTVLICTAAVAAVVLLAGVAPGKAAAAVTVAAIALITVAPRLAIGLARLPVPPVPTVGAAIDPADHAPQPTIEGVGAIGATVVPSAAGLQQKARRAEQYQTGVIIAAVVIAGVSAIWTVVSAHGAGADIWRCVIFAAVAGLILRLRGRTFADRTQFAVMVGGGYATLLGIAAAVALVDPGLLLAAVAFLLLLAVLAMALGVGGRAAEPSPLVRRMGELAEYLTIVALVPLAFWVLDIYSAVRNR